MQKKPILSGKNIVNANVVYDEFNKPVISVKLGGDISSFQNITKKNIGKRIAIVYKEVKTRSKNNKIDTNEFFITEYIVGIPVIQEALRDSFQITGLDQDEAQELSILLRSVSKIKLPLRITTILAGTRFLSLGSTTTDL